MAQKASTPAPGPRDTRSAIGALPPAQVEEVPDSVGIRSVASSPRTGSSASCSCSSLCSR